MGTISLLANEKKIYQRDDVVVTTHRVFRGEPESGSYVSVMLEQVSGLELTSKAYVWLLLVALLFFGWAGILSYNHGEILMNASGEVRDRIELGAIFLALWLFARPRDLVISSASTRVTASAWRSKGLADLIRNVELVKAARVELLSGKATAAEASTGA
jgi:hypothetical protein